MIALTYSAAFGPSVALRFASRMTSDGRGFVRLARRAGWRRRSERRRASAGPGPGIGRGISTTTGLGGSSLTGCACT